MIDIYKTWISDFGIDGFRIDTVKHVNIEFWQQFAPGASERTPKRTASRTSSCSARSTTRDPAFTSQLHRPSGKLPAMLDFALPGRRRAASPHGGGRPTALRDLFAARRLLHRRRLQRLRAADLPRQPRHGPHRLRSSTRQPGATTPSCSQRDELAHALMYLTRGQPVVYYGDEQGFTGDGGDKDARQDMFASQVASTTTTTT